MSSRSRSAGRARWALLSGVLTVLAVTAIAIAAPDRTATLSASAAALAWDGPAATSHVDPVAGWGGPTTCSKDAASYCDQTLIDIQSGGPVTLNVQIGDYSVPTSDFDLYIYKSDASGKVTEDAEEINPSWLAGGDSGYPHGMEESATVEGVEPGYYLIVVVYYDANNASYKGSANIEGASPTGGGGGGEPQPTPTPGQQDPQPNPTPGPQPTPSPAPGPTNTSLPFKASSTLGSAKKAKKSKSLKFKGTATEDISNLRLSLFKGKKVLGSTTIASFPKGTRTVKLRVSKKIKKGTYALSARGSVNGQDAQTTRRVKVWK